MNPYALLVRHLNLSKHSQGGWATTFILLKAQEAAYSSGFSGSTPAHAAKYFIDAIKALTGGTSDGTHEVVRDIEAKLNYLL